MEDEDKVNAPQLTVVDKGNNSDAHSCDDSAPEAAPAYEHKTPATREEPKDTALSVDGKEETSTVPKTPLTLNEFCKTAAESMVCVMGPGTSFFYFPGEPDATWTYNANGLRKPQPIHAKLLRSWSINWPYDVALSPFGAGYFAYSSSEGGLTWQFVGVTESSKPKKRKAKKQYEAALAACALLRSWLSKQIVSAEDVKTTKVRFGPAGRFMAWKSDGTWISNDLPARFLSELMRRENAMEKATLLQHVTFGVGDTWAAIWKDGTHSLDLDNKYVKMSQLLEKYPRHRILYLALDCCETSTKYYVRLDPTTELYSLEKSCADVVRESWDTRTRAWASSFDTTLTLLSSRGNIESRTILTSKDASAAITAQPAIKAKESEVIAREAAQLSIESLKKSIDASKVAVAAGVFAIATGCSVM